MEVFAAQDGGAMFPMSVVRQELYQSWFPFQPASESTVRLMRASQTVRIEIEFR